MSDPVSTGSRTYLAWPVWKIALVVVPLVAVTMVLAVLAVTYRGGGESAVVGANASTTTTSALPTEATAVPAPTAATAAPAPAPVQVPEPAPVPTTTPAPTVVQAPTAPTWEQIKGAQIPGFCTHPPTTLVEGRDVTLGPDQGRFELTPILSGGAGIVRGLQSPDGPLTAVVASCTAGGVGMPNTIMLFAPGGSYYGSNELSEGVDWAGAGMSGPGRDGVSQIILHNGRLGVSTLALMDSDAECCPSMDAYLEFVVSERGLAATQVSMDVGD